MSQSNKVFVIGLDSAEVSLIERWMEEGMLPNLKRLKEQSAYSRIGMLNDHLVGLPWPTFYRGVNPGKHGVYHYLQWNPNEMACSRVGRDRYNLKPFWENFKQNGPRAIVLDMPLRVTPEAFNGIEITGWATHEVLEPPNSYPQEALFWANENISPSPSFGERYGASTARQLLQVKEKLLNLTRKVTRLTQALMEKELWDLFIVVYSATHRGGHQLWDGTNLIGKMTPSQGQMIAQSLCQVYQECDKGIGELLNLVGDDVIVIVCSLHGMGANHSRTELLPEMVTKMLSIETGVYLPQRPNLAARLRNIIPEIWRHAVKQQLPHFLQDRFTSYWRMGATDWSRTPVITILGDYDGYIQINRSDRESQGFVKPEETSYWIKIITDGLKSFMDADSGKPIVKEVLQREDLGLTGEYVSHFPDLIVQWLETPAAQHREVVSLKYGTIPWPTPGLNPEGRSGNHRPQGFIFVRGNNFSPNSELSDVNIIDIAPTILNFLGLDIPQEMEGKVILQ